MRPIVLFGFLITIISVMGRPAIADEAAVKKMISDYAAAFNAKEIDSVIGFWTEAGVHVDRETGERTEGRDAIRQDIVEVFEQRPNTRIQGRIDRMRFIKPDVASVEGQVTVLTADEQPSVSQFSAILVNQNDRWLIDEIEEMASPQPASSFEALRELEWLVGHWVDESEDVRVDTVVRWTANQSFLLRSFVVQVADGVAQEGTQIIGWDPRSGEIRSWSFNSDGSFGDGVWSKNGDDWLVKSSQTLPGGQAASGTFVLSRVNDDQMTLRLIGREIEGEPQPSEVAVQVVRVADQD